MFQGLAQWAIRDGHSDVFPPITLSSRAITYDRMRETKKKKKSVFNKCQQVRKKKHVRGDVFMLQQITKDVAEEAISSPHIQRLSRPSTSIIRPNLWVSILVTPMRRRVRGGAQRLTRKSRSESVIQTRSTPCTNASNGKSSSADGDVMVSTTTSGLRPSIRAFAASTRCIRQKS